MTPLDTALRTALPDLAAWTQHFRAAEIPVLSDTADALEAMRAHEDDIDANTIGEMIAGDPLMTLKVLAHAATNRGSRMITDTETVIATLVMMGIPPFFRAFGTQTIVEERLAAAPEALAGLLDTVRRAHRAANFALGFAVQRRDPDAAVVHEAALLHDFSDMLLWCHAPELALAIQRAQAADSTLRSSAAQRQHLNITLAELQQALMKSWRLPELLILIADDSQASRPSVKTVMLAVRLARHSARGWDNAALPDDLTDIAALLNLSVERVTELVHEIDG